MAVLDRVEHDVGELLAVGVAEDGQLQQLRAGAARPQRDPQPLAELVVLAPQRQPFLQHLLGDLGLHQVLVWVEPLPMALVVAVRPEDAASAASQRGPPTSVCGVR